MENIEIYVKIGVAVFGWFISLIAFIKSCVLKIKNKKWEELKTLLKTALIPLMEEAERIFDNGEDKENWVLKKLSEKTHIDFFKYKNILNLAKNIIKEICLTTKFEINKNFEIEKEEKENVDTTIY